MSKLRGQGATEYLVILGAVLLVALVIVSLLGWFPALGGSTREQQSKSYWQGATPFSITSFKLNGTSISLAISSRVSDRMNLTSVDFADSLSNSVNVYSGATGTLFNAGQEQTLSNLTTWNVAGNQCLTAASGSVFDYATVTFTYTKAGITGYKQVGARPLTGRCS